MNNSNRMTVREAKCKLSDIEDMLKVLDKYESSADKVTLTMCDRICIRDLLNGYKQILTYNIDKAELPYGFKPARVPGGEK